MIKRILIGLGIVLFLLAWASLASRRMALVLYHLPWGWIPFLDRTLHEVTFNWSGIGMVVLCSLVIMVLLHVFLSWLARHTKGAAASQEDPPRSVLWPWRWTVGIYAALWLLFGVVMGASGLWRQGQWLAAIEPLYSVRRSHYADLKEAELEMALAFNDANGNLRETRAAFLANAITHRQYGVPTWELLHVLYFPDTNGFLKAVLIVPRDEQARQSTGFAIVADGTPSGFQPITNLAAVIAGFEGTTASAR